MTTSRNLTATAMKSFGSIIQRRSYSSDAPCYQQVGVLFSIAPGRGGDEASTSESKRKIDVLNSPCKAAPLRPWSPVRISRRYWKTVQEWPAYADRPCRRIEHRVAMILMCRCVRTASATYLPFSERHRT